jgi:GNAT superfamily N-acetyltransferase
MTTVQRPTAAPVAPVVTTAPAEAADFTARLHLRHLPDGFFPSLGVPFLRAFHESFQASPHGIALVAWLDGRPVGMLVGTMRNRAHYRWVARHRGRRLAVVGALSLLTRPALAAHFNRTRAGRYVRALRRYAGRRLGSAADGGSSRGAADAVAVLTHVAVSDDARGHGAGRALVEAFAAAAARAGTGRAELVTDAANEGNHAFYRALGWHEVDVHGDGDGDCVLRFARDLG